MSLDFEQQKKIDELNQLRKTGLVGAQDIKDTIAVFEKENREAVEFRNTDKSLWFRSMMDCPDCKTEKFSYGICPFHEEGKRILKLEKEVA